MVRGERAAPTSLSAGQRKEENERKRATAGTRGVTKEREYLRNSARNGTTKFTTDNMGIRSVCRGLESGTRWTQVVQLPRPAIELLYYY